MFTVDVGSVFTPNSVEVGLKRPEILSVETKIVLSIFSVYKRSLIVIRAPQKLHNLSSNFSVYKRSLILIRAAEPPRSCTMNRQISVGNSKLCFCDSIVTVT